MCIRDRDNGTLQHVTLHCDYNQVLWGELKPEVVGDVQWNIKEGTTTVSYTHLLYTSDFAYYLQEVPGSFFFLSSSNPEKHTDCLLYTSRCV